MCEGGVRVVGEGGGSGVERVEGGCSQTHLFPRLAVVQQWSGFLRRGLRRARSAQVSLPPLLEGGEGGERVGERGEGGCARGWKVVVRVEGGPGRERGRESV